MSVGEVAELLAAHRGAVVVDELGEHARAGADEVDCGFGVPGAVEDSAIGRAQREDVSRWTRSSGAGSGSTRVCRVSARSAADTPVLISLVTSTLTVNVVLILSRSAGPRAGRAGPGHRRADDSGGVEDDESCPRRVSSPVWSSMAALISLVIGGAVLEVNLGLLELTRALVLRILLRI